MKTLPSNFELDRYGLHVRLVREEDAEFILRLRTDEKLARYLHATDDNVEKQVEWIKQYKIREAAGEDYYFIYDKDGQNIGVNRIYDINYDQEQVTAGSWICKAEGMISIYTIIILRDIMFDIMGAKCDCFDVRKGNKKVQRLHEMCGAQKVSEDEQNYYYCLTSEDYEQNKEQILKLLKD